MGHVHSNPTFLPNRIILAIDHPVLDARTLADAVAGSTVLAAIGIEGIRRPDEADIISMPLASGTDRIRSLVPAKLPEHSDIGAMIAKVFRSTDRGRPKLIDAANDLKLVAVSPSWLIPAAYHGISHGGPGGEPVRPNPAEPAAGAWEFAFDSNPDVETGELKREGAINAHVVILDTYRSLDELQAANTNYIMASKEQKLLNRLLQSGRLVDLCPAQPSDLTLLGDVAAGDFRYAMPDHGIFAAGIIHSIAPGAQLHLVEVLNTFGVGSLESVARGMLYAAELRKTLGGRRLFVNCSLMLSAPPTGHGADEYPHEFNDPNVFAYMNQTLGDIVTQLTSGDNPVSIIAAAGNDAKGGQARPDTRYPAAFDGVISVGALPHQNTANATTHWLPASYSNRSDMPGKEGYLTLGGEPAPKRGVLGIYLQGTYPGDLQDDAALESLPEETDGHRHDVVNETGWALWAGTSFATPIITGLLARAQQPLTISGAVRNTDIDKLDALAGETHGMQPATENVIFAKQG
jgi:hypothetical protein